MQLQYIEENLNRIVQNPDSVMYLKPYDIGKKRALFAIVKEEQGVYKKVQITKAQSKGNFPFEPIYWFYQGPGYFYLKNFIVFNNWIALNITNLEGFKHKTLEESKIFKVGVFATFNDGSATFVKRQTAKEFEKKGGIQAYINLLKQHKEFEPKYDTYKYIEAHSYNDDTFVIPELLSETKLQFEKVDYQSLLYKDENGNSIDNSIIPLSSVKESVKKLTKIRKKQHN